MDADEECPHCGSLERITEGGIQSCAACGLYIGPAALAADDEQDYQERGQILRKKEERVKLKTSKIFRGRKGYKLFLQAWQHVLWRLCHAAIHVCGLPAELWTVVKDLWALRLAKLAERFDQFKDPLATDAKTSEGEEQSVDSGEVSETSISAVGGEEGQNASMISSEIKPSTSLKLLDAVAMIYVGTLLLRYPLRLGALFDWIKIEAIPFIRPIRYVPPEIRRHLASEYARALDTMTLPTPTDLQLAVLRMANMYSGTFSMTMPSLNHVPLMMSCIERLALPLQVYSLAQSLNKITRFDFTYPSDTKIRRSSTTFPESQIAALIVVATKLLFPFDSSRVKRYPTALTEPGALRMDWKKWVEAKERFSTAVSATLDQPLGPGTEILVDDVKVVGMTDDQLDQYMDWYQNTFARVKERNDSILNKQLLQMFPVPDMAEAKVAERIEKHKGREVDLERLRTARLQDVLGTLKTQKVISEEDEERIAEEMSVTILRPGAAYQSFKDVSALDGAAKVFYEEVAEVACLSVEQLFRAVVHTEQKIERWKQEERRKEIWPTAGAGAAGGAGADDDDDSSDDMEVQGEQEDVEIE